MSVAASRTTASMPDAAAPWMVGGGAETEGTVSVEGEVDGPGELGVPGAVDLDVAVTAAEDATGTEPSVALARTAVVNEATADVGSVEHPTSSSTTTDATTSTTAPDRAGGGWVTATPESIRSDRCTESSEGTENSSSCRVAVTRMLVGLPLGCSFMSVRRRANHQLFMTPPHPSGSEGRVGA